MSTILKLDRASVKQDPEHHFEKPTDVLMESALTRGEQRSVLENWLELVDRRLNAANEGMPVETPESDNDALLQRQINEALLQIDQGVDDNVEGGEP